MVTFLWLMCKGVKWSSKFNWNYVFCFAKDFNKTSSEVKELEDRYNKAKQQEHQNEEQGK